MFDDLTPENQKLLADPNYRPPGARLILALLIGIPACWAVVVSAYFFAVRVLFPVVAAVWSALS